jgi:hypothetical protein
MIGGRQSAMLVILQFMAALIIMTTASVIYIFLWFKILMNQYYNALYGFHESRATVLVGGYQADGSKDCNNCSDFDKLVWTITQHFGDTVYILQRSTSPTLRGR